MKRSGIEVARGGPISCESPQLIPEPLKRYLERERYQVNYGNSVPLMHIEIGRDILYRIEDKEKHLSLSDIKKVLETPNMIVICLRGNLILPVKKTGFMKEDADHCLRYLRNQIGSR